MLMSSSWKACTSSASRSLPPTITARSSSGDAGLGYVTGGGGSCDHTGGSHEPQTFGRGTGVSWEVLSEGCGGKHESKVPGNQMS